jgi:hypothetical protein
MFGDTHARYMCRNASGAHIMWPVFCPIFSENLIVDKFFPQYIIHEIPFYGVLGHLHVNLQADRLASRHDEATGCNSSLPSRKNPAIH